MVRRYLRAPLLKVLVPRVSAPLLPVSRGALTNAPRSTPTRLFSHFPARLDSNSSQSSATADLTLSQKLKHLIKTYGWYALGVYIVLSTLDFGVAFAAINLIGAEHVSRVANTVSGMVHDIIHSKPPEPGREEIEGTAGGYQNGGLYAMLVLAYTVHKTLFLPVRVGLTAYCTPRMVGWLRQRGWAGGEGTRRAAAEMREKLRRRQ